MSSTPIATAPDRTLLAAAFICGYAFLIGFTDNYVRVIASDHGLWQFHATRTAMVLVILGVAARIMGLRLRPKRPLAVLARSLIHGTAMLIYFGALAFLPVAIVAAGLFTAPIFVLLIGRFAFGQTIGPVRIFAVLLGFAGVVLVLGPSALAGASLAACLPVVAGALYALGNIATREWCAGESAETMVAGFFMALGSFGCVGMIVLGLWPQQVAPGTDGFLLRGALAPDAAFLIWTFVQAVGSVIGVGMMVRAYQLTDAGRVSVMEYVILPASAIWAWVIWGERLETLAVIGMALIVAAGVVIVTRTQARQD